MKLLLPFLLAAISISKGLPKEDVTESTTSVYTSESPSGPSYDYVVEIGFNLNEENVPEYVVRIIYENSTEKSITTDDVLDLYGLKNIELNEILDYFDKLNIQSNRIFSLDGFDKFLTELRIDFKEFYNRVLIGRLNITGYPLRDLLVTLEVDINNFSMGMAYGDPDPYEVFKKGNFSKYSVESGLQTGGRTLEDLFLACRDEFLMKAATLETSKIVDSLSKYNFDQSKSLELWSQIGLTMENVYKVPSFKRLLNDLSRELNKVPSLGVLTGPNNITINRKLYETWQNKEHFYVDDTELDQILLLNVVLIEPNEDDLPYIDIGTASNNLINCKFITLNNGTVVIRDIAMAVNEETYF
ncbi:hypothetical protein NQ317_005139 [Molorchus minor]|uniref:Uncharacterized protein n=1 Tax=Molorchus minor TaxID=1323400 RepID=A0ABQ9JLW2_9CUCU|nr:hypothetical protein NQ317_005139 [Molorchus minor]